MAQFVDISTAVTRCIERGTGDGEPVDAGDPPGPANQPAPYPWPAAVASGSSAAFPPSAHRPATAPRALDAVERTVTLIGSWSWPCSIRSISSAITGPATGAFSN